MRELPQPGEIWVHFKGADKRYKIITVARHSETMEPYVVYRPLYNNSGDFIRPLTMFMSEVDHEKYPEITVRYRFTKL